MEGINHIGMARVLNFTRGRFGFNSALIMHLLELYEQGRAESLEKEVNGKTALPIPVLRIQTSSAAFAESFGDVRKSGGANGSKFAGKPGKDYGASQVA